MNEQMLQSLIREWKVLYRRNEEIDEMIGSLNIESFCVGWCLGKGISLDEAVEFYVSTIQLGLY